MNAIIVFSTTDSRDLGEQIGEALVESGAAACVSIVPGATSIYQWEGKVCKETEFLMIIKSRMEKFEEVRAAIRQRHSYQVPEIIAIPVAAGDAEYLQWIHASTAKG